jgi:hypothetical protein
VRLVDEALCYFAIKAGDVNGEGDFNAETGWDLADADVTRDGGCCGQCYFGSTGDVFQRAEEAGAIARREQLLGVGPGRPLPPSVVSRLK